MFNRLFGKKENLKTENSKTENSNRIKAQLERAQKFANNRKKQIRKNQANEFIKKQQEIKKEERKKNKVYLNKKSIEEKILYNSEQKLKSYNRELSFTPNLLPENKKKLYEQKKKELNKQAKLEIEELYLNKEKEKIVQNALKLYKDNKLENSRESQKKYEIQKMNINKNYILTKLESNNYNLLYRLINGLFDSKLSDNSREKFNEYLLKNPNKKEDIMKILKAVYRLKLNKSIENKKAKIINSLNSGIENKNQFLAEIKDISSHIDLATSFHNFSKKTYYICNANQLKKNYNVDSVDKLSEKQIDELSPLYYVNGICCFNPLLRTYMNSKGVKEAITTEISKGNLSQGDVELVSSRSINNKNKNSFIDTNDIIANIEKYNNKNSILSKFFDKHILGIANVDGIHENNKKNKKNKKNKLSENNNKNKLSEINSKNFDRFCDECQSKIDTIVVVENGKITFIHTKTEKSDGIKILANYFSKHFSKPQNGGGNKQVGGVEPITTTLALISVSIGFFAALITCFDSNGKNQTIIKIIKYPVCVVISTLISTMLLLVSFFFMIHSGVIGSSTAIIIAGLSLGVGSGVKELMKTKKTEFVEENKKIKSVNEYLNEEEYNNFNEKY